MTINIDNSKLYGILNETDGTPIRRKVRTTKVGIGLPKGPDVHVWIDANGKYVLAVGEYPDGKRSVKVQRFETREEIRAAYLEARRNAAVRPYPVKLPYFTFLLMGLEGDYVHDLDAIFDHGSIPTEVAILFLAEDPLDAKFQLFTAGGLHCEGNGMVAKRRVAMAERADAPEEEKKLAAEAVANREKFYVMEICYTQGCPFAQSVEEECSKCSGSGRYQGRGNCNKCSGSGRMIRPPVCKPHGRLHFQLAKKLVIGGTCSFDTTGKRSINQLASCLDEIRTATRNRFPPHGTVAGFPLTLVVRPYRVIKPDGGPTVQHAVSLEARGKDAQALWSILLEGASEFQNLLNGPPQARQLLSAPAHIEAAAVAVTEPVIEPTDDEVGAGEPDLEAADASAITSEFFSEVEPAEDDDGGFEEVGQVDPSAATSTAAPERPAPPRSISELTENLKRKEQATPETPEAESVEAGASAEPQEFSLEPESTEPTFEQKLDKCSFVAEVNRLRVEHAAPSMQLAPEDRAAIETACDDRIKAIRAEKRAQANGKAAEKAD